MEKLIEKCMDIYKKALGICKKILRKHRELDKKYSEYSSVVTIIGVILVAVVVMHLCNVGGVKEPQAETLNITDSKAEEYYYNGEYEKAINEYEGLQVKEEWPIYESKIAEIYSVMGETQRSNQILDGIIQERNDLIDKNEMAKYKDKDAELGSIVAFTAFINGSEKATDYCEYFLLENIDDKDLNKTMFTIYLSKNEKEKAMQILEKLPVDSESAFEMAEYASMYITLGDLDRGLQILKDAWYLDKDDIKVYDVINSITISNNAQAIQKLMSLVSENPTEPCYAAWLTKYYTQEKVKSNNTYILLSKYNSSDFGDFMLNVIDDRLFEKDSTDISKEIVDELSNKEENTYSESAVISRYYYNQGDYDKAYKYLVKSIKANGNYAENYSKLIPEVLIKKERTVKLESYYRESLYKEPYNYQEIIRIGDYYSEMMNNTDKAYEYYNLAVRIKPNDATVLYKMAKIKYKNNDKKTALELINKCIELDNTVPTYYRTLGKIYYDMGKKEEVIAEIRKAYKIDENDPKTLNNAGCYYITNEGNITRGVLNLKYAYEGILNSTDSETKKVISENYERAKELQKSSNGTEKVEVNPLGFELFY